MALFKQRPKTARQKAQNAQSRIIIRLACCAYMVFYVIIPLMRAPAEDNAMHPALKIVVVAVFIAAVAAILALTIREFVLNWKAGNYKADAYDDDPDAGG